MNKLFHTLTYLVLINGIMQGAIYLIQVWNCLFMHCLIIAPLTYIMSPWITGGDYTGTYWGIVQSGTVIFENKPLAALTPQFHGRILFLIIRRRSSTDISTAISPVCSSKALSGDTARRRSLSPSTCVDGAQESFS